MGHDVTVVRRSCYVPASDSRREFRGVRLVDIFAPRIKSIEAVLHTFLAVLKARSMNPDVLHVHAIGPAVMVPLARLLGLRVVLTHHGFDYNRGKWGRLARTVLRTGEKWGARRANKVIVISHAIQRHLAETYGRRDTALIYNGVTPPRPSAATDFTDSHGLAAGRYVVAIGRFVPEKCFDKLIEAFMCSRLPAQGFKLAIAGDADHPNHYSEKLKELAARHKEHVVLTGFIKGEPLNQLMSHAALFCLPSTHEGLPISLLEAMGYGLDVLVSDIEANLLPELDAGADTFPVGDTASLAAALERKMLSRSAGRRTYDLSAYNWDCIAQQTVTLYSELL